MTDIEIRRMTGQRMMRKFHQFPWRIYRNDPLWVPPRIEESIRTTDPKRGVFFKRGEAEFFMAFRGSEPVGRICAAHDPPTNEKRRSEDCIVGFFECIDDIAVAHALFDTAAEWGKRRGLEWLVGPYNLDYENAYGVLISGRDRPPALMCGHTATYYHRLFTACGFEKQRGDQLAFAVDLSDGIESETFTRLFRLASIVEKKGRVTIRGANLDSWDEEIGIIHNLLVRSLAHLPGSIPWRRDVLEESLTPFKSIADPDLILFAMYDGEPVGWFPGVPNLNEVLISANGLRYPWNYVPVLMRYKRRTRCVAVKSVLVLPEYWKTGAAILMFSEMAKRAHAKGYSWVDLSLTGEGNEETPVIASRLGAYEYKRYRIYHRSIAS